MTGLFEKPQFADGSLKELAETRFRLVGARVRDTKTKFGDRTAVDLKVDIRGVEFVYSGFSAGILQQVKAAEAKDFPVWCTIEKIPLAGGRETTQLRPVSDDDSSLPEVEPPSMESSEDNYPQSSLDDDIPF